MEEYRTSGSPVPRLNAYYLGALLYFFENACGISGYMLGINPFNQPGVEAYKKNMFALLGKPGFEKETARIKSRHINKTYYRMLKDGNIHHTSSFMKDFISRIPPTVKGITLAFLATLGMANVYVFSKAALLEVYYFQFQFYWFGFAMIWILPFLMITGMIRKIPKLSQLIQYLLLSLSGFLELGCCNHAVPGHSTGRESNHHFIFVQPHPHFCNHPGNPVPGRAIQCRGSHRDHPYHWWSYTDHLYHAIQAIAEFFGKGSGWILVSSVFSSISIITAKSRIKDIHPGILTLNRVVFIFVFAGQAMLIRQESFHISGNAAINMAIGSLLGPFLTGFAQYSALQLY